MSKKKISFLFWKRDKEITNIFNLLGKNKLFFVGGAVRNTLKGIVCEDLDIAANIEPNNLKNILKKNDIIFFDNSKGHGTVTVKNGNFNVEITSFRLDVITFGRKAKVNFTNDIYLDSCRRDFTINAIYSDFNGNIYDPHEGLKDLNNKIVKFIGDPAKRIKEDNLRILRYFRFVAQYSKSSKDIEKKSLNACINNRLLLRNLSKERLNFEFKKLILSDNAGFSISLLKKYQIIDFILDGLGKLNEKDIKLFNMVYKDFSVRLAYLAHKAKLSKKQIKKSLKLSNKQTKEIELLLENDAIFGNTNEARTIKYYYGEIVALKKYKLMIGLNKVKEKKAILNVIRYWTPPMFPLTGKDLIELGLKGKNIGRILREVEKWWIDNSFKANKQKCLKKVKYY